jgi:isochorismate synthase EntC
MERKIVSELAEGGSRNHKLLMRLEGRGAVLMGTESPELLLAEYNRTVEELAGTGRRSSRAREMEDRAHSLLSERDRYIAGRINATLAPGETAVLFLGMLHNVEPHLEPDIRVIRPVRR